MVQTMLMLTVFFRQNFEVEFRFVMLLPALNPTCSIAIISAACVLSLFKRTFSTTLLADEDHGSVVLAEL